MLLLHIRISDVYLQHEPVHLGFRKRVCPFLLNGILRRHDKKRLVKLECILADGHLPLLHRLKERALHFRRGPVYLIGQDYIREDRAFLGSEIPVFGVVDKSPYKVGRQKIRRELQPLELGVDRLRQRLYRHRLGESGNAFNQHMPVREKPHEEPLYQIHLPYNNFLDLRQKRLYKDALFLHLLIYRCYAR